MSRPDASARRRRSQQLQNAREAKKANLRTRSRSKGTPRGGQFAGASEATFLEPLPPDAPSGRLSPPPKVFDLSSIPRKRNRSGSLSPPPRPLPKSDLAPSPLISSSRPGLITTFTPKLGKMPLINTYKRLQRRRRGRPTPRRFSSHRQRKKSRR